jgi:hypothetical protein
MVTIGGSGIFTAREAWSRMDNGFDTIVLGETLLQSRCAARYIKEFRSQKRRSGNPFENVFTTES